MKVIEGGFRPSLQEPAEGIRGLGRGGPRTTAIEAAYLHFRLDRQGNLVSQSTLENYDWLLNPFFEWLRQEYPDVRRFDQLTVDVVREYRAYLVGRPNRWTGKPISASTVFDSHRSMLTFFRWVRADGYPLDWRILELKRPKRPDKEPTVFHLKQLRAILAACNPAHPQEEMAVRILIGSGVRASELCGLCAIAPDGLSDVMTDSLDRGHAELRVRWDGGAKGKKSRRIPITAKLAAAIKRYEARYRDEEIQVPHLLLNYRRQGFDLEGLKSLMDRLQRRTGFHVHAHAFRHTFATVATQMGWNFERLRAAMGHSDYDVLHRYVRLATERDLGRLEDWLEFIAIPPQPQMLPPQTFVRRRVR